MHRLRDQRGQATIDYVALLALLAVLVTVTASLTGFAPGIVNATLGQFRRALCIVRGGDCPAVALQPCTVASKRDAHHVAAWIGLGRVDEDHVVLRERMSDGTVRLTVFEQDGAGVTAGIGGHVRLDLKGRKIGFDRELQGLALGVIGHGSVYVARNDRDADEILRSLRSGFQLMPGIRIGGGHPRAQSSFVEGGMRGLGRLGLGVPAGEASLDAMAGGMLGASRNRESGEVTISLNVGGSGTALLNAVMVGPTGTDDAQVELGLKFDRHGTPIQLSLEGSGTLTGGDALSPQLQRALEPRRELSVAAMDAGTTGRRWAVGAQVDLRDPEVAMAWKAFRHDPTSGDAIRALGAVMRERAQLDVRSYEMRSDSNGGSAGLAFVVKVGGEYNHAVESAQLLTASTRPPGGLWERRFDCVPA